MVIGVGNKAVDVSGICINCERKKYCDFMRGIKSYMRYHKCANIISDIEISIYSCKGFEPEISKAIKNEACMML